MDGKTSGRIAIVYDCHKKKPRNVDYYFSCFNDGHSFTAKALKNLYAGSTVISFTNGGTSTLTIGTKTDLTSSTASFFSTATDIQTALTTDVLSQTVTSVLAATSIIPETLVQSHYHFHSKVSVTTQTLYPVVEYSVETFQPARRAEVEPVDNDAFCAAYIRSCSTQCNKLTSTSSTFYLCKTAEDPGHFSLSCICKGSKIETQHALANIGAEQHVQVVSTIATYSTTATVTNTVVVPTTFLATTIRTTTSRIPSSTTIVSNVTSTGTLTATSTTSTTSIKSTVTSITTPTSRTASTQTMTSVTTTTATTIVIVAPTGVVQASYSNGSPNRYISRLDTTERGLNTLILDKSQAAQVMLVYDPNTKLYALQYTTGGLYMSIEAGPTMSSSTYGFLVSASGRAPGPAGGKGPWQSKNYESFCYSIDNNAISVGYIPFTANDIQPNGVKYPLAINEDDEDPDDYIVVGGSASLGTAGATLQLAIVS